MKRPSKAGLKTNKLKSVIFFLSYLLGLVIFSLAVDQILISRFSQKQFDEGIIFKPFTKIIFQSLEYQYNVYINNYGFRDRDKKKKLNGSSSRIIAIGDSFTYGWGVEVEESWPKVLEEILQREGFKVEVDNLGKPGAGPSAYAEIAEKAIPVLKPKLLILGMLQGDDLAQALLKPEQTNGQRSLRSKLAVIIRTIYPYSASLIAEKFSRVITSQEIHQAWRAQARQTYSNFSPEQKTRFNLLDQEVKSLFFEGELNPAVIHIAITNPDYYWELKELTSPKTKAHIAEMANALARIKEVAQRSEVKVLVVSIPHRVYVGNESDFNTPKRFGFHLPPELLSTNSMDQAIEIACRQNGILFFQFTEPFRERAKNSRLFFPLDGHLNKFGHQLLAELVAPVVKNYLE